MHMNVVTAGETLIGRTLTLMRYFTVVIDNRKPKIGDQLAGLAVVVGNRIWPYRRQSTARWLCNNARILEGQAQMQFLWGQLPITSFMIS